MIIVDKIKLSLSYFKVFLLTKIKAANKTKINKTLVKEVLN